MSDLQSEIDRTFRIDTIVNLHPPSEPLQLSPALCDIAGFTFEELSSRPAIKVSAVDDSFPLTHYYISSSHNTYLLSRQLVGKSTSESYRNILQRHGRCVEIDAWPAKKQVDHPATCEEEEPVVTHGYTWSKSVSFRSVCRAINDTVEPDTWPVMISLECHVDLKGQEDMVRIMKEELGSKLVDQKLDDIEDDRISPRDLKGRVICMIEYYPAPSDDDTPDSDSSSADSSDSSSSHPVPPPSKIAPTLATLGYYARSMKPSHAQWFSVPSIFTAPFHPLHVLVNISESKIHSYPLSALWAHAQHHLRRVFPKGTRIGSSNMDLVRCWRNGSHVVSVNWQEYDRGMQINEAMFVGTDGWLHKPNIDEPKRKVRLLLTVAGVSALPEQTLDEHVYARVQLFHADGDKKWKTKSIKPSAGSDGVVWNETLEWTVDWDELAFVRLVVQEDEYGKDDKVAVFCARVANLLEGWRPWRLLDMGGKWKGTSVLVKWEAHNA